MALATGEKQHVDPGWQSDICLPSQLVQEGSCVVEKHLQIVADVLL